MDDFVSSYVENILIFTDDIQLKFKQLWIGKPLTSAKDVLGFIANFYQRFIKKFSKIAAPLYKLIKKNTDFSWTKESDEALKLLKQAFVEGPVLAQFDLDHKKILETNSCGYCSGRVLSQVQGNVLRPIDFFSKKHSPAKCNYPIYDKGLLAIIRSLEEWKVELKSVGQFTVLTHQKNLE